MKKLLYSALGLAILAAASCKKDVSLDREFFSGGASGVDTLREEVTANVHLTRTTYIDGVVFVHSPFTLTIDPGVTLIGSAGPLVIDPNDLTHNKGTIVIDRGAKIQAVGTATAPIVWTSSKAAGSRAPGDWGGLILLGAAPIHTKTGATTNSFEGLPANNPNNQYGGTNAADNSGSVAYNRFEFGGGTITVVDQEINGVTLCGVGSGTSFHHVEVSNSGDDAFEFFGGTLNVDHLIAYDPVDDEFDFDEGYHGNMQFLIGYRVHNADVSGSHGIESDNDAAGSNVLPHVQPFIANATMVGPFDLTGQTGAKKYDGEIFLRRSTRLILVNSLIICNAQPYAVVTTPLTQPLVASVPNTTDSITIANNIFQISSAHPVIKDNTESAPIPGFTDDNLTLGKLSNESNTSLLNYAAFKLDAALRPQAGSPALSGGINLASLGLPFVGTTQRGAVISSDPWTFQAAWVSIAAN